MSDGCEEREQREEQRREDERRDRSDWVNHDLVDPYRPITLPKASAICERHEL
jgi:hypothetical protein